MSTAVFSHSLDDLRTIAQSVLQLARQAGASAAEVRADIGMGQNVSVRMGDIEATEYNQDNSMSVSVYFGQKSGHASTSDLRPQALQDMVNAACSIARYIAADPYCGLADAELMAQKIPELDLYHPWTIDVETAITLAKTCEAAAFAVDARIHNSEGASVSSYQGLYVYANSHGFNQGYPWSRHSMSCSVLAESDDSMQRDYWYSNARAPAELDTPEAIGRTAGERTVRRLNGRRLGTLKAPVLFEAHVAGDIWRNFISAISGGNLYRKSSFLLDSLGKTVCAPQVVIDEDPHIPRGLGSSPFDHEGVATRPRQLVSNGVLQGYILSSYSARKLGMTTTGNAGGKHNLCIPGNVADLAALTRQMQRGLIVTEVLGHGMNLVTGDYSRGVAGFWVENGTIQYPVEEITIASNLRDMLKGIVAMGNDQTVQSSIRAGSILIDEMTIAGE